MRLLSFLVSILAYDPPTHEHWEEIMSSAPVHTYSDEQLLSPDFDVTDPIQRRALDWVTDNYDY